MNQKQIDEQLRVFADYLKSEGLKMTHQREIVVENFLRNRGHISADELFDLVKKDDGKIGLATIFRTLRTLSDCGLAREINLGDGRTRFEPTYKRPHHHHLICEECNQTIEFYNPEFEALQEKIVNQYRFISKRHVLQIFGICKDCQKQKEVDHPIVESDLVFARDALQIAMETEKRGVDFYSTAAEIVSDESTRTTFLEMLDEEKHHLEGLEKEWDRLIAGKQRVIGAPVFLHFDYDELKRIFPSRQEVQRKLNKDISAKDALELAMGMERDAHNFFKKYAQRFNDTKGRDIFLKFAKEEREHYDLIKKEYDRHATASS